jgi:large subunit ribosomal protein L24
MLHIRKNDEVIVIAGKDKGKTGRVIRIFPEVHRALVENINLMKKAKRRTQQDQQGGLIDVEMPIHLSNIMLIDKKTNKPSRFGTTIGKDGLKLRVSKKSNEVI